MARFSKMGLLLVTLVYLVNQGHCHAKVFSRCQLSRELLRYNFPRSLITHWVCLIENTSERATDKVVVNENNTYTSYGLFQINNKDWCKNGRKGGICNMKCEDLLNEDLADDVRCAKRVYDRVAFNAWPNYSLCKKKALPDLSRC